MCGILYMIFPFHKECPSENTTGHNLGECQTFPRARIDWYPVKKKLFNALFYKQIIVLIITKCIPVRYNSLSY
jgi:hypothetical protein